MTLGNPADTEQILNRMRRLRPDAQPAWGRMNVQVCSAIQRIKVRLKNVLMLLSGWGLYASLKWRTISWPKCVPTTPQMDQKLNPAIGSSFEADVAELLAVCRQFSQTRQNRRHAIFGELSEEEWQVWGWRHADHHLPQFGV
jgi:hypothetical protein